MRKHTRLAGIFLLACCALAPWAAAPAAVPPLAVVGPAVTGVTAGSVTVSWATPGFDSVGTVLVAPVNDPTNETSRRGESLTPAPAHAVTIAGALAPVTRYRAVVTAWRTNAPAATVTASAEFVTPP